MKLDFVLRDYQHEAVNKVLQSGNDHSLIVLPVASGKTIIFSKLAQHYHNMGKRVLILMPKVVLIEQTDEKIPLPVGILNATLGKNDLEYPITIATPHTVINRNIPQFDVCIIDEVHRANMDDCTSIFYQSFVKSCAKICVGFTATPYTIKGPIFGKDKFFPEITYFRSRKQMLEEGHILPITYQHSSKDSSLDIKNFSKLEIVGGDYNQKQASELYTDELIDNQVQDALKKSKDRNRVVWICTTIKHCEKVYSKLDPNDAIIIHSKLKKNSQEIIDEYIESKKKHLVSVLIASEGLDIPQLDCLVLMRPTRSPVLYIQAVGRIVRKFPNKNNGLLLDYGNTVLSLGDFFDEIEVKAKKSATFKLCPSCDGIVKKDSLACNICGYRFYSICKTCNAMLFLGENCPTCTKPERKNPVWNLCQIAYNGKQLMSAKVFNAQATYITSKANNPMVKVTYKTNKGIIVEYFVQNQRWSIISFRKFLYELDSPSKRKDFFTPHDAASMFFKKIPTELIYYINQNNYHVIKERLY